MGVVFGDKTLFEQPEATTTGGEEYSRVSLENFGYSVLKEKQINVWSRWEYRGPNRFRGNR